MVLQLEVSVDVVLNTFPLMAVIFYCYWIDKQKYWEAKFREYFKRTRL